MKYISIVRKIFSSIIKITTTKLEYFIYKVGGEDSIQSSEWKCKCFADIIPVQPPIPALQDRERHSLWSQQAPATASSSFLYIWMRVGIIIIIIYIPRAGSYSWRCSPISEREAEESDQEVVTRTAFDYRLFGILWLPLMREVSSTLNFLFYLRPPRLHSRKLCRRVLATRKNAGDMVGGEEEGMADDDI